MEDILDENETIFFKYKIMFAIQMLIFHYYAPIQGRRQVHKALQDKTLAELDSSIKPVIEKLMPENTNNDQESTIPSTDPSISGSMVGQDMEENAIEGEAVAEAFSVLSQYFQTLSHNFQVSEMKQLDFEMITFPRNPQMVT